MKTTLITILLVLYVLPNCCYGQLADTLTKKDVVTKYADSSNFKLGALAGIGSHQGVRVGAYVDIYGFRFGGGKGYSLPLILAFFGLVNVEYTKSIFMELPLKISRYVNIGTSYTDTHGFDIHDDEYQYMSVYLNYERFVSNSINLSLGFGVDWLTFYTEERAHVGSKEFFHLDLKIILEILKVTL